MQGEPGGVIGIVPLKGDRGYPGTPGLPVCLFMPAEESQQTEKWFLSFLCNTAFTRFLSKGLTGPPGPSGPPGPRGYQGPKVSYSRSDGMLTTPQRAHWFHF